MYNNRIYSRDVFVKELDKFKKRYEQLYCEDCLEPWEFGMTNLNSIYTYCPNCNSISSTGVSKERMRELKIRRLTNER